jgi:hypothetical protein
MAFAPPKRRLSHGTPVAVKPYGVLGIIVFFLKFLQCEKGEI